MSRAEHDRRIDYVEFPVSNVDGSKKFYSEVFGWGLEEYGPDYCCFMDGRLSGAFFTSPTDKPAPPLVVIYTTDLQAMEDKVTKAGGTIVKPVFEFPGGKRFHFTDPSGHELAVWTDQ
jgi:uncharacterized protein